MPVFGPLYQGDERARVALAALLDALQSRHAGAVDAVLFYGSCLRSGDLHDGLVDLYVIVRDYRSAHRTLRAAAANRALGPNVYYLQTGTANGMVRCKYAVLSMADLERGVSRSWFESYIWGRFCQPVAVAHHRDETTLERVRAALRTATITFLDRALPAIAASGTVASLWTDALALSYATELRAESGKRSGTLVTMGAEYFSAATREVATALRWPLALDGERYAATIPPAQRRAAAVSWGLRRVQGKLLSVARLLKALLTFEGGFDYIAWKLERHSGRPVVIPPRVRKYPLIFVWALMWRLYREGILR
jgi:hypothetical protein